MKTLFFLILFCAFFAVEEISAQRRWTTIQRSPVSIEVDANVRRLPNGNITYWSRYGGFEEILTEVDCVNRQSRSLALKKYDSYGNVTENTKEVGEWKDDNDSMGSDNNALVCRANPREEVPVSKPVKKKTKLKPKSKKKG
jgi:hypothetical protein